jgi:hypothetical protein
MGYFGTYNLLGMMEGHNAAGVAKPNRIATEKF